METIIGLTTGIFLVSVIFRAFSIKIRKADYITLAIIATSIGMPVRIGYLHVFLVIASITITAILVCEHMTGMRSNDVQYKS